MEVKAKQYKWIYNVLPVYARWILENKLNEFVLLSIQLCRKEELPLIAHLSRFSDEELVGFSTESNIQSLTGLAENTIEQHIFEQLKKWIDNKLGFVEQDEIVAEDLSIGQLIKRRGFYEFLDEYTTDKSLIKALIFEIDSYTSQEELIFYKTYIDLQQDKVRKANEELKLHQELLLSAEEIGLTGSFHTDLNTPSKSLYTPQYFKILELDKAPQLDTFLEYIHPEDLEIIKTNLGEIIKEGGEFECGYRYLINGKEKNLWTKGIVVMKNGKPESIKGTLRDATEDKELISQLQQSVNMNKQVQELTNLGNWTWDIKTNKIEWSDEMYRIYGLVPQSEEISFERFISLVHPDDRENRIREIEKSLSTLDAPDYILRIIRPTGVERILRGRGWVQSDYLGEAVKLHGTCQDMTWEIALNTELVSLNSEFTRKNAELERINKELESFTYIASHDMQEPLRKIHTFTDRLLETDKNLSEKGKELVHKTLTSVTRMQKLMTDLISFSQVSSVDEVYEVFELNNVIEEVTLSLAEIMKETNTRIKAENLPSINGIFFQFNQLFSNIISNAIKYRKENESPLILIRSRIIPFSELKDDKYELTDFLEITITDNGIGFEEGQGEKIFDLFTRLHSKNQYSGTGIGLAICKKIVQQYKGYIEASSNKDIGTVFRILLPKYIVVEKKPEEHRLPDTAL